jgi:hypothetical protein
VLSGGAPELKRYFGYLDLSGDAQFVKAVRDDRAAIGQEAA